MRDFTKLFITASAIVLIIGIIIGLINPHEYKGYSLISPEPGIKCAKVSGFYSQTISCWRE